MTRISAIVLIAAVTIVAAPGLSLAQGATSPRGTNSAGAAQSSGGLFHRKSADGGALGTGRAKPPAAPSPEAVIQQENTLLERKLKGICRGC
jgi:hypothetical protein